MLIWNLVANVPTHCISRLTWQRKDEEKYTFVGTTSSERPKQINDENVIVVSLFKDKSGRYLIEQQ